MAELVDIKGSDYEGKLRNPLGVVGLSFITLGIYYFFWYFKVNKELAEMGRSKGTEELGTSPGTSLLAVTLGSFIIVPPFVSHYKACKRLNAAERVTSGQEGIEAPLLWLLWIFISPVGIYLFQRNQNRVLEAQAAGEGAGAIAAGSAIPQPAPPVAPEAPVATDDPPQQPPAS